jgi:type IV pilus assembly protein PilP
MFVKSLLLLISLQLHAQNSPQGLPPIVETSVDLLRSTSFLTPYIYQQDNRRDPFRPFKEIGPLEGAELVGPLLPLQRFDLSEIKLVGIIWDIRNPKAMFIDPTKKVHTLNKDDRIGRNNGYVAAIREGEVVVVETVNIRGELAYNTRVLQLER